LIKDLGKDVMKRISIPKKYTLTKELWIVVTIKAMVIYAIWALFFSHPASDHIKTDEAVAQHFYQSVPVSQDRQ